MQLCYSAAEGGGGDLRPQPRRDRTNSLLPELAATVFAVAAFTGARRGEVAGLRWETITRKTYAFRSQCGTGKLASPK